VPGTSFRNAGTSPAPRPTCAGAARVFEQQSEAVQENQKIGPHKGPYFSASRSRFRPPRPTGLPLQGCPFFVEPLGHGFDLVAFRARCKGEATRCWAAAQECAHTK